MGPPPADPAAAGGRRASPSSSRRCRASDRGPIAAEPRKDHILESGGSGVAAVRLRRRRPARHLPGERVRAGRRTGGAVPHRNALYRNLGGWKFQDVSAAAGVDAAAWGNGVCAGDYDDDGDLDLYVTNWGPNLLFRNNGDGTFTDAAAAGRRAGRRLEHRLHVLRRRRRRRPRPLRRPLRRTPRGTSWPRAQRTLVWRGGPKIMVGPVGPAGRGRPLLREPRATARSGGRRGPRPGRRRARPTASACSPPTTTTTAGSTCSWPTTPTRTSSTTTAATGASRAWGC